MRARVLASPLDTATRHAIADTKAIKHSMPPRPYSRALARWLCRTSNCSLWSAPDETHCPRCRAIRSDA